MHLVLIDASNLFRSQWEVMPARKFTDPAEATANAFAARLDKVLRRTAATHALVAFEGDGPAWRATLHPEYKATREPAPPRFLEAMSTLRQTLAARPLCCCSAPGLEAEDVIASVTLRSSSRGVRTTVVSTDKDLFAVLEFPGVQIYHPPTDSFRDAQWLKDSLNLSPDAVADWLAIMGDTSDNVPGIPGVGSKLAAEYLEAYGDLDGVIAHTRTIGGKRGAAIAEHGERARRMLEITTLRMDLELGIHLRDMALPAPAAVAGS
jgi:DNA polymerase-1